MGMIMKRGGNGIVTFDGDIATKTLDSRGREKVERFKREVEVLRAAQSSRIQNVVELLEYDLDAKPPWFRMRKCTGDLDDLLPRTRRNPQLVASIMIPAVKALQHLGSLPTPIYHRDLKPANLLYNGTIEEPELIVADFGCAFLADEASSRITEDLRAVGATFFRAPEYTHGRVENVTSAGDIFSLGKLLWYLCNGVENEVFPYTLWFPEQYNLSSRCTSAGTRTLNLIIASCVSHDPAMRIGYPALIPMLDGLKEADAVESGDDSERTRIMAHEAELSLRQEESVATCVELLEKLQEDLRWIAGGLERTYAGTRLTDKISDLWLFDRSVQDVAFTTVIAASDIAVLNWNPTHLRFHIHAYPPGMAGAYHLGPMTLPFLSVNAESILKHGHRHDRVFIHHAGEDGWLIRVIEGRPVHYSREGLMEFINLILSRIGT
jgi:serine/threonine protein kinase